MLLILRDTRPSAAVLVLSPQRQKMHSNACDRQEGTIEAYPCNSSEIISSLSGIP